MKRFGVLALAIGFSVHARSAELSVIDRTLLIEAEVDGHSTASVVIATRDGAGQNVAGAVVKVGGSVVSRQDDIGYVLADLPLAAVRDFARRSDIVALQVSVEPVRGYASAADDAGGTALKGAPPGPWLAA